MANYVKALLIAIMLAVSSMHVVWANKEPAVAGKDLQKVTVDMSRVRLIKCGGRMGTGVLIAKDRMITAYHVARTDYCEDQKNGRISRTVVSSQSLDYVEMKTTTGELEPLKLNCEGFNLRDTYYSIGYANGSRLVLTTLSATPFYTLKSDMIQDMHAGQLRILRGTIIRGMSGGPIVDVSGAIVGMNQATAPGTGYSREIADTPLCKK